MTTPVQKLLANPLVAEVIDRDEREHFGEQWAFYEGKSFEAVHEDVRFHLSAYVGPTPRFSWSIKDPSKSTLNNGTVWRKDWALFYLTYEESVSLAEKIGLPAKEWLDRAMAAVSGCKQRFVPNMVDLATFHAMRAND